MDDPYMGDTSPREPSLVTTNKYSKIGILKKLLYALIVITCTVVLIYQVNECVEKYLEKNTGTGDQYVHISKTSFPVMTVCPTYSYNLSVLAANGVGDGAAKSRTEIQWNSNWLSNDTGKSPREFYGEMVLKPQEVIAYVKVYTEQFIDGRNILKLKPEDRVCGQEIFVTKEYYYNGDCFAFNPPECVLEAGILEIQFEFFNKTDIFIHHKGQFLSPNSRYNSSIFHGVPKFVFGKLKISLRVTTDSDTVFREKSIGEDFKIVTVAVFEKILLLTHNF